MKVILDTNIWISFLLGKRLAILKTVFERDDVEVYVSEELLNEIKDVAFRPKFSKIISTEAILDLLLLIDATCKRIEGYKDAEAAIRDNKDLYLLSMAEAIPADYLVSGDKDLLVLKNHLGTQIITFSEFINILNLGS